jgi:hypothetical protein
MGRIVMDGGWRVRVVRADAGWPQRVVVTGSASLVIPGVVGRSAEVKGQRWALAIEHQRDGNWRESEFIDSKSIVDGGGHPARMIHSKDHFWHNDHDPNDLVLMLDMLAVPPAFQVVSAPRAVDASLRPVASGFCNAGARYLAVEIANSGEQQFGYGAALDISGAGRTALARHGVRVLPWSAESVRVTRQEVFGSAVSVPPLVPGQRATVYLPVDSSAARDGTADVEFELRHVSGSRNELQVARNVPLNPDPRPTPSPTVSSEAARAQLMAGPGVQLQVPPEPAGPVPDRYSGGAPDRFPTSGPGSQPAGENGISQPLAGRMAGRRGTRMTPSKPMRPSQ